MQHKQALRFQSQIWWCQEQGHGMDEQDGAEIKTSNGYWRRVLELWQQSQCNSCVVGAFKNYINTYTFAENLI